MKSIDSNGQSVRYDIAGPGSGKPWVTLSHSLSCHFGMWDELAAALAPRFNVLRYDTRGHGGSTAPASDYSFSDLTADLVGLLDALAIERTNIIGLSMGGMIAQHFALSLPARLDRLVIASSSSRMPPESAPVWEERIRTAREQGMGALVEGTLSRWFTPDYRAARPEVMARIGAQIAATPVAGFVGCAAAIRSLDITERIGAIAATTLVIVGADDPGTPPAMSETIAGTIPGARLEIISKASHLCCIEQAETFNRLVADFLA